MQTKCVKCRKPLRLVNHANGGIVILDEDPHPNGRFIIVDDRASSMTYHPLSGMLDVPHYSEHSETCPVWNEEAKK